MGIRAISRVQLFPPPGAAALPAARAVPCPPCRRGDARALPPLRGSAGGSGAPRAAPPGPLLPKPIPEGEGTPRPPSAAPQGGSSERSGRPSGNPRRLFPASLAGSRGRPSCWGREGAATGPPGAAHLGGLPGPRGAGAGQAAELAAPGKCRGPTRGPGPARRLWLQRLWCEQPARLPRPLEFCRAGAGGGQRHESHLMPVGPS